MIGYETKTVSVDEAADITVRMESNDNQIGEAVVTGRRGKYSRKTIRRWS